MRNRSRAEGRPSTSVQQPLFPDTEDATLLIQRITDEAIPDDVLDQPTEPLPRIGSGVNGSAHATDKTSGVVRAGALMAVATVVSRLTGLLAKIAIAAIIGDGLVNSSYLLANTLPNIVFELLVGGVLTSVAIPLLTRAQRSDADGGLLYTQRLLTLSSVGLAGATGLAVLAAPLLTRLYLSSGSDADPELATRFAVLLLPQIFFYGIAALFGAILNTKERFAANAWAPVLNNLVVIAVAITLALTHFDRGRPTDNSIGNVDLLVLGTGTTLGIVVQALVMLPALRRSGFEWKWRWGWDRRFAEAGSLLGWATVYVLISQVGVIMATRVVSRTAKGGVFFYQTASLIFQMPYGILGVAVLTAIMPRMSRHAAERRMDHVKDDMSLANRLSAVALLPVTTGLIVIGTSIAVVLFRHGHVDLSSTVTIGFVVAGMALGLLPLAMSLIQMRVFYAMKDARTPTIINAIMVAVRVPLMLLAGTLGDVTRVIAGIGVATSVSYLVGAVVGEIWLRARYGPMGTSRALVTMGKMLLASVVGGVAAFLVCDHTTGLIPTDLSDAVHIGLLGASVGLLVIALMAVLLRVEELNPVRRRVAGLIRRSGPTSVAAGHASPPPARASLVQSAAVQAAAVQPSPPPVSTRPPVGTATAPMGGSALAGGNHRTSTPEFREQVTQRVTSTPPEATVNLGTTPTTTTRAGRAVFAPGMTVGGRYRLVSLVTADTAGNRFWRAKDTVLPRDMAVTLLPNTNAASATVARTLRVGRLHHIGLPQTLDVGTEQGESYVVGQWVDGATLTDLLSSGPLEPDVATSITAKLAEAVAEAHRNGIALGAINPSLVRVNFDGQVRLSHVIAHGNATPEQDIKAVGALLYLMLTGLWPLSEATGPNGTDSTDGAVGGTDGGDADSATVLLPVRSRTSGSPNRTDRTERLGLTPAPTRLGREVPADELRPHVPQPLAALAERALHPDDPDGIHAVGAIAALLRRPDVAPAPVAEPEPQEIKPQRSPAERRLMRERRIKLSVAALMIAIFAMLIVIVVASVGKQMMGGLVDSGPTGPVSGFSTAAVAPVTTAGSAAATPTSAQVKPAPVTSGSAASVLPPVSASASASASPSASASAPVSSPIKIVNATVFDPEGDGNKDYTGRVGRAFDGNPATSWSTFVYNQQFPEVKQGVGLTVELDHPVTATSVQVTSDTPNTRIEVRSASGNDVALASTQVLGSGLITGSTPLTINLTAAQPSKYLIVWVTQLAPSGNRFQSDLSEIVVSGH